MKGDSSVIRLLCLKLLLLLVGAHIPLATVIVQAQLVDVSLRLQGVTLSSDALVDVDDILQFPESSTTTPANNNEYHNESLLCLTDLEDCCNDPRTRQGEWYYPNGNTVSSSSGRNEFQRNRGANEVVNDQPFYGSVRLFRQGNPPERGRFRCELPNAANPFVNRILYANILDIGAVTISTSGSNTAGGDLSLVCSASIATQSNTPRPHFQWFFDPNNSSLPFRTPVTTNSGNTYTSTLQFPPLSQSHAGMYTCQLGGNARLAARTTLIVNAPPITVRVTVNFNTPLMVGRTGYALTCDVSGSDNLNPTIAYQWTRSDGTTQTQVGSTRILNLFPFTLSHAGDYTCSVIVSSPLLNNDIITSADNLQSVTIQIPDPQSVTVTSSHGTTMISGSDVTVNCTVELGSAVLESELSLLLVNVQLSRDGAPIPLSGPTVNSTTFTYTTQLNSFGRNDSGNYTCTATVRPQPTSTFLTGMGRTFNTARITTGVYFSIQSREVNSNGYLLITDIGEGDYGALQCFTDNTLCCSDTRTGLATGHWFYPNGSLVGTKSDGQNFYVERGPSVVRLNRRNNATSVMGQFCCEVPDAASVTVRVCVNAVVPQSEPVFTTTCTSEVAIGVVATILLECLLAVPIVVVVLTLYWKRRKASEKNTLDGSRTREIYEEPDQLRAATTTAQPGNFELTKCPAYMSTTNEVQPTHSSEYEYVHCE